MRLIPASRCLRAVRRWDVILAGVAIVATVMRKLGADELTISDRGLRHGLFYDRFVKGGKTTC